MIDKNSNIRFERGIYYRLYGECCYIWNTKLHKQYVFNSMTYNIIELIKREKTITVITLVNILSLKYKCDQKEILEIVIPFLEELSEEGILHVQMGFQPFDLEERIGQKLADEQILATVLFELTYDCNLRCQHCYVDSSMCKKRKVLSVEEVKHIIDNLYRANVSEITFTGGELFTRRDAVDIIEYAADKGFLVNIFSNGTLLDDSSLLRIAQCHIKSYQSSLYGSTAILHDKITRTKGSYDKTVKVINTFSKLGIATCIKTTMMQDNVKDYNNLVNLAESLESELQVGLSIMPTMARDNSVTQYRIDPSDLLSINIAELKRLGVNAIEETHDEKSGICSAGYSCLTINPWGDILLCTGIPIILGNALCNEVSTIWNTSSELEKWRTRKLEDIMCRSDCKFSDYCSFCPAQAYLETGNCFEKYEEACNMAQIQFYTKEVLVNGTTNSI